MGAFDDLLHGLYCLDQPALFRYDGYYKNLRMNSPSLSWADARRA
jgi:hypothetical protein